MHQSRYNLKCREESYFLLHPQETSSAPVRGSGLPGSVNQNDEDMSELVPVLLAQGKKGDIFPGFTTLQLVREVPEFLSKMIIQPEDFTGRIIVMSMFNDISWRSKNKEQECELSAQFVST